MPDDLTNLIPEKNRLSQPDPFIWLIEARVPGSPPTMVRITPNPTEVTFGAASDGTPIVYTPFPVAFSGFDTDSEGGLPTVSLSVSNITREIMAILVTNDFLVGETVNIHLVHKALLFDPTAKRSFRFTIQSVATDEEAATFELGVANLYNLKIPNERISRDYCGHNYKDLGCGFVGDPGEVVLGPCALTLEACEERGAFELANGLTVQHPQRRRAAMGIARRA